MTFLLHIVDMKQIGSILHFTSHENQKRITHHYYIKRKYMWFVSPISLIVFLYEICAAWSTKVLKGWSNNTFQTLCFLSKNKTVLYTFKSWTTGKLIKIFYISNFPTVINYKNKKKCCRFSFPTINRVTKESIHFVIVVCCLQQQQIYWNMVIRNVCINRIIGDICE